ncbi:hypothetical protein K6Y31_12105 [Motilimonas cestriensis]|uniref:Uncharacterized protein n=1 Tax=Motilimonas cestriensis TaxID=2742685 RepID=A0ABS8WCX3_9GAMM|nr:hypothetical protein [Motilimonas cestriensis]MCE2595563.1 hypothetical protein [Motilimonas cestriensis]
MTIRYEAAKAMRQGKVAQSNVELNKVLIAMQQIAPTLAEEQLTLFNNIIQVMNQARITNDWLYLADIIEYELTPFFEK